MISVNDAIVHIRNREYMSGIERDKIRIKSTGEIFTKIQQVNHALDEIEKEDTNAFKDPTKTFIDPSVGDGNLLGEILIRKVENGIDFETALSTIYGCDIMKDNVKLCQDRLLCGREDLRHIVERNIICGDALTYHYRFDGTDAPKSMFTDLFEETQ